MMGNPSNFKYEVVLFKNQERKKTLNKYQTLKNAEQYFKKCLFDSDRVQFEVKIQNGSYCEYEIGLIENNTTLKTDIIKRDVLGKNIIVETTDSKTRILKLENYKIPEKILDNSNNTKITMNEFITNYINSSDDLVMISKLNNRIIRQIDDNITIFTCKSDDDAERFIDTLESYTINELNVRNCLYIRDVDTIHRKYLYNVMSENGYDRKVLYRKTTTHLKDKRT